MLELNAVQCASPAALSNGQTVSIQLMAGEQLILHCDNVPFRTQWLRMLAGRHPPSSGQYLLAGENLYSGSSRQLAVRRNRRIGLIDVSHPLLPHLNLQDNIALAARYRSGVGYSRAKAQARQILDVVGLGKLCRESIPTLSGEQRALALFARALVNTPNVIILHDPALLLEGVQAVLRRTLETPDFKKICIVSLLPAPLSWRTEGLQYDLKTGAGKAYATV